MTKLSLTTSENIAVSIIESVRSLSSLSRTDEPRETFGTIEYSEDGFTVFFATELELPFDYETIELTAGKRR